jgi:hypothetical protein
MDTVLNVSIKYNSYELFPYNTQAINWHEKMDL